jgi:hypothetical protein
MHDAGISPAVRRVRVGDVEISVRELAWPDALEWLARIGRPADAGAVRDPLAAMIAHAGFLIERSTDLPSASVARLPIGPALTLAATALELTFNEEVLAAGKAAAERLRRTFGRPSPPSSSSCSPPVTSTHGATPCAS